MASWLFNRNKKDEPNERDEEESGKDIVKKRSHWFIHVGNTVECFYTGHGVFAHVKVPQSLAVLSIVFIFYMVVLAHQLAPQPKTTSARLWFAPFFHDELNALARSVFTKHLEDRPIPQETSDDVKPIDVCPIILAAATRPEPHWAWLTATLLRRYGYSGKKNVLFNPTITIISRPKGALSQNISPYSIDYIARLKKGGVIQVIEEDHAKRMPPEALFEKALIGASPEQSRHFVLQLFDHALAWEICAEKKCSYCLVLEDDAIMSRGWSRRLKTAINVANGADPTWGVLKLFETEDGFTMSDKKYARTHFMMIGKYGIVAALPPVLFWRRESQRSRWMLFGCFLFAFAWSCAFLFVIDREWSLSSTNNRLKIFTDEQPTQVRKALIPLRGAVANVYRNEDLNPLITHAHEMIWKTLERKAGIMDAARFYNEHADRIRVDVLVGEYFLKKQSRSVKIVEPNLAQHIGFRSSEPGFDGLRVAMSSTFEDGRIF